MSKLSMPKVDRKLVAKKTEIVKNLKKIINPENVLDHEDQITPFETDALTAYKQKPLIVVFPENTQEVSSILAYCNKEKIKVVPRGAGTGLSGGALPLSDCVLLCLGKFNKIINIDYRNRCVTAQPGVTNLSITEAVQEKGFYYAPDPSSQIACSIGGNVAENSGGVHSLKYGTTTNNLLGVEVVFMDGTISRIGGKTYDSEGYDLLGLQTYFTAGPKEVRAWTTRKGALAPVAAGEIHSDFTKHFIRAEVIPFTTYVEVGGEANAKNQGLMQVEGKEYVVEDGDVMHFRIGG